MFGAQRERVDNLDVPSNMYLTRWEAASEKTIGKRDQVTSRKAGGSHFLRGAPYQQLATPRNRIYLIVMVFSLH